MFRSHVDNLLFAYDQGELSAGEAKRVAAHLERCVRCQEELQQIRCAAQALREAPLYQAPDSLWPSVESALDADLRSRGRRFRVPRWSIVAAAAAAAIAVVFLIPTRPHEPGWAVVREEGGVSGKGTLGVGQWLVTGPETRAHVQVSQIGEVDVEPNSRLRLLRSRPSDNRLSLARGAISARIWAPPKLFFVETPSALAVDLGCAYRLSVDDHGAGLLRVTLGWVELQDHGRDSMVPAGAACRMRPGAGPGTPYFEDAPAVFTTALARFDSRQDASSLSTMLSAARPRDGLTLVHLLARVNASERPRIVERLTALGPLPGGVTREGALAADPRMLRHWIDELAWNW